MRTLYFISKEPSAFNDKESFFNVNYFTPALETQPSTSEYFDGLEIKQPDMRPLAALQLNSHVKGLLYKSSGGFEIYVNSKYLFEDHIFEALENVKHNKQNYLVESFNPFFNMICYDIPQEHQVIVHLLVTYHNGIKLDVFNMMLISTMKKLETSNKYDANDETCQCGESQCLGCLFKFKSIKFIGIVSKDTHIPMVGNFGDKLVDMWLDNI